MDTSSNSNEHTPLIEDEKKKKLSKSSQGSNDINNKKVSFQVTEPTGGGVENVKNDDKSDGRHHLAPLPPKKSSSRDHKSNHHRTSRHERSRSEERHSRHNDADKDKHNRRRSDKNDAKERRSRSNVKEQDSYV